MAVWCHNLTTDEDLYSAVKLETFLTHSNETAIHACILFCYAIRILINNPGDAKQAYEKTKEKSIGTSVQDWFTELESGTFPPATKQQGHLKIAFTHAFAHLREAATQQIAISDFYIKCMRAIIGQGGDTDTNAAIVGALIGALVGLKNIPREYSEKILAFDVEGVSNGYT